MEEKGISAETADKIGTFVKEKGPPLALLSKFKQEGCAFLEHAGSMDALKDLEILFKALDKSKRINKVVFDLSLARGLDYYTGVIFEAVFTGGTQVNSHVLCFTISCTISYRASCKCNKLNWWLIIVILFATQLNIIKEMKNKKIVIYYKNKGKKPSKLICKYVLVLLNFILKLQL